MNTFENREKAAEAFFAASAENEFKARARRDKLVGNWAAGLLGLKGDDVQAYAKSLVVADLDEPGDGDVIAKLAKDFAAKGVKVSVQDIEQALSEKMAEAIAQIKAGT